MVKKLDITSIAQSGNHDLETNIQRTRTLVSLYTKTHMEKSMSAYIAETVWGIKPSLPYFIDAPECFIIDTCVLCDRDKPMSKVICDICNGKGIIELGIRIRDVIKE